MGKLAPWCLRWNAIAHAATAAKTPDAIIHGERAFAAPHRAIRLLKVASLPAVCRKECVGLPITNPS